MSKFKSPVNSGEEPKEKHQPLLKTHEALKNPVTWGKWLTMTYQSFSSNGSEKQKGPMLDNCPGCGGLGFIGATVKKNPYKYWGKYDEGFACPICLTGKKLHERQEILFYPDKPICQFTGTCPFKTELQKQEKCKGVTCKFDIERSR